MSMQDPVSDLLTQIRNGQAAKKESIMLPSSKLKIAILKVLQEEGFIDNFHAEGNEVKKPKLTVFLKYYDSNPVINKITRVSRPGLRAYYAAKEIPKVLGGLGLAIVSTSNGVMSGYKAKLTGCGGELLCTVE